MNLITAGVFASFTDAEYAIQDLKNTGIDTNYISLLIKDLPLVITEPQHLGMTNSNKIGSLAGLLQKIETIHVPETGSFFISGPVFAPFHPIRSKAEITRTNESHLRRDKLLGLLVRMGFSDEDASMYEGFINDGNILVTVSDHIHYKTAITIFEENDAISAQSVQLRSESSMQQRQL